jgi:hypothetical protein
VPEIIDEGVTGFVVENVDEAVEAVRRVEWLNRDDCRRAFEQRFDAARMTRDYVQVYHQLAASCPEWSGKQTSEFDSTSLRRPDWFAGNVSPRAPLAEVTGATAGNF